MLLRIVKACCGRHRMTRVKTFSSVQSKNYYHLFHASKTTVMPSLNCFTAPTQKAKISRIIFDPFVHIHQHIENIVNKAKP